MKKGFILIEFIISMGIMVVIVGFIGFTMAQLAKVGVFVNDRLLNQQGLDLVFNTMVTEIRSIGPSSIGDYSIQLASSSQFVFFSDVDKDGIFERIRYIFTSTTLDRGIIEPTGNPLVYTTSTEARKSLVTNIIAASSSFAYFDDDYNGSQNPLTYPVTVESVRVVKVEVYVDIQPASSPEPAHFSDTILIRNLKNN